ncbi:hypothetical protein, partial [Kitasatospora sp. NPDC056531]|uniref:hypothetical protein n=1 Tax=Kitasatospora sp. NPDC056531 TaxID=3345856 RepID=UPI00368C33BA
MPLLVAVAVVLQLLLAATFVVIPIAVWRSGAAAQQAAEAEVVRQGHPAEILARHGIRFAEQPWEFLLALAIAACLSALAALNIAGNETGRVLSWIVEPLILLLVGSVIASQVFARRFTEAAFRKSSDAGARTIDVRAVLAAVGMGFPSWVRPLVLVRFPLATAGSLLVILLLSTGAADTYFR